MMRFDEVAAEVLAVLDENPTAVNPRGAGSVGLCQYVRRDGPHQPEDAAPRCVIGEWASRRGVDDDVFDMFEGESVCALMLDVFSHGVDDDDWEDINTLLEHAQTIADYGYEWSAVAEEVRAFIKQRADGV